MNIEKNGKISRWIVTCTCLAAALALASVGYLYYRRQEHAIKMQQYDSLKAIASLKIDQIIAWRDERLANARLNSSGIIQANTLKWLPAMHDAALKAALLTRLGTFQENEGYQNMFIAALDGRLLLSLDPSVTELDTVTKALVARAAYSREPRFGDFFRNPLSSKVSLDIAAPILDEAMRPVAALILRIDPEKQLYPIIRSWPVPSRSAMTLLVRRDGEDIVYLNELPDQPGPALTLRISLSRTDVPAVQAVLGKTGAFEGTDYRGVNVLAVLQPIPGLPWFMVAKEDAEEILAEARYRGGVVLLLVTVGILMTFAMAAFVYNSRQRNLYRALFHAELERRKAQEEIRATLYGIGDGVIATDADGKITRMNPVAANLTGWAEAEAVGRPLDEVFRIINEETRATVKNPAEGVLHEGRITALASHTILVARDGTERPIADSGAPIRNDQGATGGMVVVFRDQTAERAAEEAMRDSEARLRRVIEGTNAGTWEWNVQNGQTVFNERWTEILGYSPTELGDVSIQTWLDLAHPEDLKKLEDQVGKIFLRECFHFDLEYRVKHRSGRWVWVQDRGKVIEWTPEGKPGRMAGTRTDISERHALENQLRQAQKMESVGRLAGGVAHDFNNMLGVILGYAEMAMELVDPAAQLHAYLREIRGAAQRSADLTRQLLAFARKQAVSPRVLDLNETVSGMLAMLRRLIGEDIELLWRPWSELWPVKMDPTQVHQILANLSVNARDAIVGVGRLTIETRNAVLDEAYCTAHEGFTPGDYILLTVGDTGTGMDKETLEHLFEPFFTTKEVGKGTGLGLATVYGTVKQNLGFINVYSELRRGTTFEIYLPRAECSVTAVAAITAKPAHGSETVLLAEDEQAILSLSRTILEQYGYTVLAARSPSEALTIAEKHGSRIDLLVTDMVMPGMNGKELKDRLSAFYPGIKVLFMSGYSPDVVAYQGLTDEGIEFLQKPFSVKSLAQKVREILHRSDKPVAYSREEVLG
jgi:two-component system, cell cycle sensor histidine kinase and response regulator CckA